MKWFQSGGLSDMLSAEDQTPPIFGGGGPVYNSFSDAGTGLNLDTGLGIGKPLDPISVVLPDTTSNTPPIVVTTTSGAAILNVDTTQAAGGFLGAWYWVRNQLMYGIPGLFTSAKNRVASMFTGSASSSTAKVASSSDSSWMLYALLAGAAAAAYFYFTGKKGKKSIFPAMGRKSAVKLH